MRPATYRCRLRSAAEHDTFAERGRRRLAEVEGGHIQLGQRLHQSEAGLLVVAEHMTGH